MKTLNVILSIILGGAGAQAKTFKPNYKDRQNLEWSGIIGRYTNGCNYRPDECSQEFSVAENACRERGARLPTLSEFQNLAKELGTYTNLADELRLPDNATGMFWTSTGVQGNKWQAYVFWARYQEHTAQPRMDDVEFVCVR